MIPPHPISFDARFLAMAESLESAFLDWERDPAPWPEGRFEDAALEIFALQWDTNRPYRRYCDAIGVKPGTVASWTDIPAAPTAAFRAVELVVGDPADVALRFRTSGTSRGAAQRGVHPIRRPETYRASLAGPFRRRVLCGVERARFAVLHAPFSAGEDSSLAWMLDEVLARYGTPESRRFDPPDGIPNEALFEFLAHTASGAEPLVLLGTTLAMAELSREMEERGVEVGLPPGSRIMDTGGAKGRTGLDRPVILGSLLARLGLGPEDAVNEFGMTELLSQRYASGLEARRLEGPPWLRSRVLDPVTLDELPAGSEGILCHCDLANVGSVLAVLTEDRGRIVDGAVEWLGRSPGAPPRGCSLATAELLDAQA